MKTINGFTAGGLLLSLCLFYSSADADTSSERPIGLLALTIGAVAWDDLGNVKLADGSGFDSVGYSVALAGHLRVTRWGRAEVLVGADIGTWGTESDLQFFFDTQTATFVTPSLRFVFGKVSGRYLIIETGAGWYKNEFSESACDAGGNCVDLSGFSTDESFGGYVGIAAAPSSWFFVEAQAHLVEFDEIDDPNSGNFSLKGPIYMLNIGIKLGG
jgi:hypothetical protein